MEAELLNELKGKNTIETARIISKIFVNLFGVEWGTEKELTKILLPRGKANSWAVLDKNLTLLAKQFYPTWEEDEEKISFLDEVRFTITSLPMKLDYKQAPDYLESLSPRIVSEHFTTCSLCWRSVLKSPLQKKTPLCHLHDLPSTSNEYRKRQRLKKQVEQTKLKLIKSLPPLVDVKHKQGAELNHYTRNLCLNEYHSLHNLRNYLNSLNMPLDSYKDLVEAIEHPIYKDKLSSFLQEVWNYYLEDRAKHFRLTYIQLLTAEAWLETEKTHKHGGKRR